MSPRGTSTTEFWATMVFHASALAMVLLGKLEADWAVAAMGVAQGAYNVSRGLAKKAEKSSR